MDPKKAKAIHLSAYLYALKRGSWPGSQVDADDFAQEVVLYALENDEMVGHLRHRYSDFLRSQYGRVSPTGVGTKSQKGKKAMTLKALDLSEKVVRCNRPNPENLADMLFIDKYFRTIPPVNRIAFVLHHKYGYNLVEIAEMCGLTEARISQIVTETKRRVLNNVNGIRRVPTRK